MGAVRSVWLAGLAACGRVSFGYPDVPCEQVVGTATSLDPATEHCYARFEGLSDFPNAQRACSALGGHLATISGPDEQATIIGMGLPDVAYIGLGNGGPGDTNLAWITREPLTFTSWTTGQPALCPSSSSAAVIDQAGEWSLQCVSTGTPFVCEIPPWTVRANGHAYRVLWWPQVWSAARTSCEELGAHLVTIDSREELDFVSRLVRSDRWIGATVSAAGEGTWITGEPFSFTAWAGSQPNEGVDACVAVNEAALWVDNPCDARLEAVCELEP